MAQRALGGLTRSLWLPLLAMLHMAFAWLAALIRVLAGIVPQSGFRSWLILAAAALWLVALLPWSLRHGAMVALPRVDGRPG